MSMSLTGVRDVKDITRDILYDDVVDRRRNI